MRVIRWRGATRDLHKDPGCAVVVRGGRQWLEVAAAAQRENGYGWRGKGRARTAAFEQGSQQGGRGSRCTTTLPGCFGWHALEVAVPGRRYLLRADTVRPAALALLLAAPDEPLPPRAGGRGAALGRIHPRRRHCRGAAAGARSRPRPGGLRRRLPRAAQAGQRAPRLHGVQAAGDAPPRQRRLRCAVLGRLQALLRVPSAQRRPRRRRRCGFPLLLC